MFIRNLNDCQEFISGDGAILREIVNAAKEKFDFNYSLAHAIVKPGITTKPHKLKSSETYYIIQGQGIMYIDGSSKEVSSGSFINIPPLSVQYIKNSGTSDLVFLCIVEPSWKKEDEIVLE